MGDDGVGPAAIEHLRAEGFDQRAELWEAGLAFSEVLCDLKPDRPLVIIDAVRGGGAPGEVYRLDLADLDGRSGAMSAAISLHELSVLPALRMETLAGREFSDVTIFGVEPGRIDWVEGLSTPVAKALKNLTQAITEYLDEHVAGRSIAACGSETP